MTFCERCDMIVLTKNKTLGSMEADELRRCLDQEVATWCRRSYSTLRNDLEKLVTYTGGEGPSRYEVEVRMLENKSEYVQIGIAVDDGYRAYRPLCHSTKTVKETNGFKTRTATASNRL
jgi:hypothetical protein